jgi:hypothetical protein
VLSAAVGQLGQALTCVVRLDPLVLLLVQLLQIEQRVLVVRIELQHFVERLERPFDEPAALVIGAETQQHVGVFELAQARPLEQGLVDGDRLADLALLAIQVAEDHVNLERVGVEAGRTAQFFDRHVDLIGDEEIEPEDVVGLLAGAPAIDPLAVAQLVPLPGLADGEPREERDQRREYRSVGAHAR